MKETLPFYGTQAWKDCRAAYRKKMRGLCELCLKEGKLTAGVMVHHKEPLTPETMNDPNIALNFDNLQLLCREHHAQAHGAPPKRFDLDDFGHVIIRG